MLYLDSPVETLAFGDWNAPVAKVKPAVLNLRKELGVATQAFTKP